MEVRSRLGVRSMVTLLAPEPPPPPMLWPTIPSEPTPVTLSVPLFARLIAPPVRPLPPEPPTASSS